MGNFEDELWTDLLRAHGDGLATAQRPAPLRSRTRPLALTAGAAGVVGVGTVLALTLTATTSVPAYAVTENSDGTVTVTLHDISGVTGINAKLAALGVRARAVTPRPDCTEVEHPDPTHRMVNANTDPLAVASNAAQGKVVIQPRAIPVGDTLVLTAKDFGHGSVVFGVGLVLDPAPSCEKQDLQPPIISTEIPSGMAVASPIPTS
ncbi:MAG TPA: hypothetical protein VH333_04540 [Pseudonocardiaceae bacterium]|jgi:hypothetical protein|nr:hypothetical protein [Pseudonocardiaceae bacterium]